MPRGARNRMLFMSRLPLLLLALSILLMNSAVQAEKADQDKPIVLEAEKSVSKRCATDL